MPKLTLQQIKEVKRELVPSYKSVVCRFFFEGHCLNICTGDLQPKGINVIHQISYWNFTKKTAKKIAKWLNCRVYFDESNPRDLH